MLGYIENRLKYVARKSKAFMLESVQSRKDGDDEDTSVAENDDEESPTTNDENDTKMRDLINDMKSWANNANDLDSIKLNLRKTRNYRKKMMLNKKTDLLESFPYFFVNIDLVSI